MDMLIVLAIIIGFEVGVILDTIVAERQARRIARIVERVRAAA